MATHDPKLLKLGKGKAKIDPRALKAEKYLSSLPAPPASVDWTKGVTEFGMMLNGPNSFGENVPTDGLGDCTCAAVAHGDQIVTINSPDGELTPPDQLVLNLYEVACGYVPGQENTDQGGVIIDVLNYVKVHGLGHKDDEAGHHKKFPLLGYADVDQSNLTRVRQSIAIFGVNNIGLELPISAQSQTGAVWDVVGDPNSDPDSQPGSWGGHSVVVVAYDQTSLTCITWGSLQKMTHAFLDAYCDESHALLYGAWLEQYAAQYPEMLAQLTEDLKLISA